MTLTASPAIPLLEEGPMSRAHALIDEANRCLSSSSGAVVRTAHSSSSARWRLAASDSYQLLVSTLSILLTRDPMS